MDSRSSTRRAAQAAANSASSQDDDSSRKKITFNMGSIKANGRKKNVSSIQEPVPISSDTDYPNSGSSAGVSKPSSQLLKSSQDDMFGTEIEELPSLTVPSSGSSSEYHAMKNSLTMSQGSSISEHLALGSPEEGIAGKVSRTSTPQKRRLEKTASDPRMTLQNIAEEIAASQESNADDTNIESVQVENPQITSEDLPDSASTKRKRHDSQMSDTQLPDTLACSTSDNEAVPMKKSRQSVEIIGIKNKMQNSCATPVVDLEDESDDDTNRLYLSQSQSQPLHMSQSESFLKLSQQITPILVDVEEEADLIKDSLLPSTLSASRQKTNGNSFLHDTILNVSNTLPFIFNKSSSNLLSRNDLHLNNEMECLEVPSSLRTFARVKDNLASRKTTASPRSLSRIGNVSRLNSTPHSAEVIEIEDSHNTPENTNGTSLNHDDITTSYHSVVVVVNYSLSVNSITKSCTRELVDYYVHEGGDRKALPVLPFDDVSPGALADVSGQSKTVSPASVTSTGMFPLPEARRSIVSTISSSSSLDKGLKLNALPNTQWTHPKPYNKSNDKNVGRDLNIDMCISDKLLTRLENVNSVFASPNVKAQNCSAKKAKLNANGKLQSSIEKSSSSTTELSELSEQNGPRASRDETLPSTKSPRTTTVPKSLPPTKCPRTTISNGSKIDTDVPSPETIRSPSPPSASKATKKAAPSKRPFAQAVVETPRSSTKKRAARSRSTKKRATGSRKAKMPPIVEDVPQVKEVTPRERKPRVPPARKALMLTSKPVSVEKPSRRMAAPEELIGEDILDPPITPDQPILAFAWWANDQRFYPCTVVGRTKDGKCSIKFDDGTSKNLADEFVIPVGQLRKGLSVFAKVNDNDYEPGTIFKLEVKDGVVMYVVELDTFKSVTIPRSALFMTKDQATVLQEETWGYTSPSCVRRPADVSLDNMVGGKRRRFASVIRRLPKVSGENRPPQMPTPHSDTSDDVNYSNEDIYGIDIEFYPLPYPSLKDGGLSKAACKVKGRGKDIATEKTTDIGLNVQLGPIPEDGCKLFMGMHFLFTSVATDGGRNAPGRLNESTANESSASYEKMDCKIPLIKERLVAQLVAGGGVVHERFEQLEQLESFSDCYLIASGPCQTAKFLLCLANRVPIISHDWVISSVKAGKRQRFQKFYVPAGRSIIEGGLVVQKERAARDLMLKNMDVLVVSDVDHFIGFWTKVLEAIGARVSSLAPDSKDKPSETDVNVVLSDNSILGSEMRTWADTFGVRVVNTEWVKYCLIKGVKGDLTFEGFSIDLY